MERGLIWYILSLKNYLLKRSTYLTVAGMLLLVLVISGISIPSAQNMKAGIVCNESNMAEQILERLPGSREDFEFIEYDDEEDLIEDVISGTVDCGFVFSEDFDEMCEEQDIEEGISYYATSFSTKGEVLKETVCATYLECYSQYILADVEEDIFGDQDPERMEKIMTNYQLYLEGNEVFQMEIDQVEVDEKEESNTSVVNPVAGLIGLTIFLIMFFAYGESNRKSNDNVGLALTKKEQIVYRFVKMLAAAMVPAVVGLLLIFILGEPKGVFIELGHMIIFLIISAIWLSLVGKWLSKSEDLSIWLLGMILIHLLVCPIFFDFAAYVPAIAWIRYVLPLGIYFML
ncbi:MAG: ABC transporter permease [Agathobacter sp.]|nr:ABC transporter permease [Agathobacter sp.]